MLSSNKSLRACRLSATHARAHEKEISFALVPMEEAQGRAGADRTGRSVARNTNTTSTASTAGTTT